LCPDTAQRCLCKRGRGNREQDCRRDWPEIRQPPLLSHLDEAP